MGEIINNIIEILDIKFRGVDVISRTWVYGSLLRLTEYDSERFYIVAKDGQKHKVFPASIGICSTDKDVKEEEIYSGDVVRVTYFRDNGEHVTKELPVIYSNGALWLDGVLLSSITTRVKPPKIEIIGNISGI